MSIHPTAKVNFRAIQLRGGSTVEIGEGSIVDGTLIAEREGAHISIGRNTFIGASIIASAQSIEIGSDVLISWGCTVVDHNSHAVAWSQRKEDVKEWYHNRKDWTSVAVKPVKIGNKVWLGLNVIVLKGVEIGEGSIVAAGSIVTKSIPSWTMVAGNPARVIREISMDER
jgi:acetyltransferase-like isoleucine patch superfamily enzyme